MSAQRLTCVAGGTLWVDPQEVVAVYSPHGTTRIALANGTEILVKGLTPEEVLATLKQA